MPNSPLSHLTKEKVSGFGCQVSERKNRRTDICRRSRFERSGSGEHCHLTPTTCKKRHSNQVVHGSPILNIIKCQSRTRIFRIHTKIRFELPFLQTHYSTTALKLQFVPRIPSLQLGQSPHALFISKKSDYSYRKFSSSIGASDIRF